MWPLFLTTSRGGGGGCLGQWMWPLFLTQLSWILLSRVARNLGSFLEKASQSAFQFCCTDLDSGLAAQGRVIIMHSCLLIGFLNFCKEKNPLGYLLSCHLPRLSLEILVYLNWDPALGFVLSGTWISSNTKHGCDTIFSLRGRKKTRNICAQNIDQYSLL